MAARFLRFLLDQNFPEPQGFTTSALDATVMYEHLRSFDKTLTAKGTPDWLIYLRAHESGFDGLVTRDWHQSAQAEEMEALTHTRLSVITWKRPVEDPVVEWGQLLAYMPEIKRLLHERGSTVVFLPRPQLSRDSQTPASEELGLLARDLGIATGQIRRDAKAAMRKELARRGLDHLVPLLDRRPRRPRAT